LRVEKPKLSGESREAYLERVLRGKRARVVRELMQLRARRKAKRLAQKRLPDLSQRPHETRAPEALLSTLLAGAPQLSNKLALLHDIYIAGGYETAETLATRLERDVIAAAPALRARALPILTRVFMTTGAGARALDLWQRAGSELPPDHPQRQALLLELGALAETRFVSQGALLPYLADAAVQAGRGEEVLDRILASPWAILLNPELELLVHNAVRRTDASYLAALNRFFARHHLGRAALVGRAASANWLSRLAFEPRERVRVGPLVSVIMSARNARHTIGYAIDSILAQTYQPLELLVCDDASGDDSYAFVREHYAHEPRVRLFRSRQSQGTYNVRNQLIAEARGELITFQDADDLSLPTRIATQVHALTKASGVASICEWLRVRPDGSIPFFPNGRAARLSIVSLLVTRRALLAAGPYPSAKIGADLDIYRRILRAHPAGAVVRSHAPLLLGLWSEQSLTRSLAQQSLESGYRAPARRRYSELVFRQDLFGTASLSADALEQELLCMDNFIAASELLSDRETR
jgi:Glycosyl transferase family 2